MEYPGILSPCGTQTNRGSLGEGRRPGEWIKGAGEDVALDDFDGARLLLELGEDVVCRRVYVVL